MVRRRAPWREDDLATARWSEQVRRGEGSHADNTVAALTGSREAAVALALGPEYADPHDVEVAARVDAVNFAIETYPSVGGFSREAGSDRLEPRDQLPEFGIGEGVVGRLGQLVGQRLDPVF